MQTSSSSLLARLRGYSPVGPPRSTSSDRDKSLSNQRQRKPIIIALCVALPLFLIVFYWDSVPLPTSSVSSWTSSMEDEVPEGNGWEVVAAVKKRDGTKRLSWGALKQQGARSHIRENLRDDKDYLFTMYGAGWNNQVITMINLVYLAHLSGRIPIVPSFRWNREYDTGSKDAAVSEFFDLSLVSSSLDNLPIIEMHEVKGTLTLPERLKLVEFDGEFEQYKSNGMKYVKGDMIYAEEMQSDMAGCWSVHESGGVVAHESGPELYQIRTPYTPIPRSVYNWEDDPGRPSFRPVSKLIRHSTSSSLGVPEESLKLMKNYSIPTPEQWPDKHLSCIDTTFGFVDQINHYDVGGEYRAGLGAWAVVGSKMRFQRGVELLGKKYLREIFGLQKNAEIPNYVAVHIRRGDFGDEFLKLTPRQYAHTAHLVMETLRDKHGVEIKHILATSDESDPAWLAPLSDYGIKVVNHTAMETLERYGHWWSTVLDSYMLSSGKGFVGVIYSTMSILAYRRTIDWHQGVSRMIELDHYVPAKWEWEWDTLGN